MTALALLPLAAGLLLVGAAIVWPLAYRAGLNSDRYVGRHRLTWSDEVRLLLARKPAAVEWTPVHAFVRPAVPVDAYGQPRELAAV
jgi:hypothetical protein